MLPFAIVASLIVCCLGQTPASSDPTKVCFPDNLQFDVFNLNTDEAGIEAIDFKRNLLGYTSTTKRMVQDFTARKTYLTDANGRCQVHDIPEDGIFTQCLPPTKRTKLTRIQHAMARAVFIAEANWGFGPNLLPEDGYELTYNGGTMRMLITKQPNQPRYIMISKFIDCSGNFTATIYLNPITRITQANIFDIPKACTPVTVI